MACQKNVILLTISVVSSAIALTGTLIGIIGEAWVSKAGENMDYGEDVTELTVDKIKIF